MTPTKFLSMSTLLAAATVASAATPTGYLNLDTDIIRSGGTVKMEWAIDHPNTLEEDVNIDKFKTITEQKVDAYMIGTAVSNHRENTQTYLHLGDGWKQLYYGNGININRNAIRYTKVVGENTQMTYAARVIRRGLTWVFSGSREVIIMKRGDRPSDKPGWGADASLESYVKPYLKNGVLDIGPRDLMIAGELTAKWADRNTSGYDSNDSIVLLRFTSTSKQVPAE